MVTSCPVGCSWWGGALPQRAANPGPQDLVIDGWGCPSSLSCLLSFLGGALKLPLSLGIGDLPSPALLPTWLHLWSCLPRLHPGGPRPHFSPPLPHLGLYPWPENQEGEEGTSIVSQAGGIGLVLSLRWSGRRTRPAPTPPRVQLGSSADPAAPVAWPCPAWHLPCASFRVEPASGPRTLLPQRGPQHQAWPPGVWPCGPLGRGTEADPEMVVLPSLSWLSGVCWEGHQGPFFFLCPPKAKCLCGSGA